MERVPLSTGRCNTCAHPERVRIELMLANGVEASKVGRQFGLSKHSVWRHFRDHVTERHKATLRMTGSTDTRVDLEALKRSESESLLSNLITERVRLQRIADACEDVGNHQDAVRASGAIVRVLELVAKYLGELKVGNTTINQNFLLTADWFTLRKLIQNALRPHPDAQRAVLAALREHEAARGADVTAARAVERAVIEHCPQESV